MMTRANDDRRDELKFLTEMIIGFNDYSMDEFFWYKDRSDVIDWKDDRIDEFAWYRYEEKPGLNPKKPEAPASYANFL